MWFVKDMYMLKLVSSEKKKATPTSLLFTLYIIDTFFDLYFNF